MFSPTQTRSWQWLCLSLLSILLFSNRAFAQTTSTTILGTAADTAGAVVANAKIVVTNTGTGVSRSADGGDSASGDGAHIPA